MFTSTFVKLDNTSVNLSKLALSGSVPMYCCSSGAQFLIIYVSSIPCPVGNDKGLQILTIDTKF